MITYILTDGKQIVLPIDANEILHSRFCDARACEKAFFLLPESEQTEAIHAQMIIDYVGLMVDSFDDTMPFGELRQIKEGVLGFNKEVTVCRVYGHLLAVINAVKEPTFPIIIKETLPDGTTVDSEFTLASTIDDYALGGGQFTAGEVIESLIYEQALSDPKNQGDGFNYLHQANIDFDLDLTVIAHILRKPGVKLPFNTLERARYINDQKHLFTSLTVQQALSIGFFLTALKQLRWAHRMAKGVTNISLKAEKLNHTTAKQGKRLQKGSKKPKKKRS